ncbi:serine hydrolase domain-containing protein [Luteimonas arsenica]|uniref:serine hydrolase domain-containing protein n=1 Tax=Luteimonas arsenica TaxID=1586242 RepID=UPI00105668E3|nr:serine hydrolase domain-containing protein [Luteimonas arsenica]
MNLRPALLFLLAMLPFANATANDATERATMAEADARLQRYTGDVPGAALLVLHDGEPLLRRGMGLADVEAGTAVTPATNFRLASVSKQFTAAAVLLLAQDGRLRLDDPVRRWLPALPANTDGVTLHHLLSHTSGVYDYEDLLAADFEGQVRDADVLCLLATGAPCIDAGADAGPDGAGTGFAADAAAKPPASRATGPAPGQAVGAATAAIPARPYFAPGTAYRYSNSGYALLSLVVEAASGMSYPDFLRERIFVPLGMADTLAHVDGVNEVPHRAFGHSADGDGWRRTDQSTTSAVLGDGGIYSSIDDLAKWDAALYDDRLLSDASRELAFSPQTTTSIGETGVKAYGYGWRLDGDLMWHSGETMGFRNIILRWPVQRLTVILLSNRNDPEPYADARAIGKAFLREAAAR